jgi:tetratricopeptide (TPR) repeat protein
MKAGLFFAFAAISASFPASASLPDRGDLGREYVRARAAAIYDTPEESARRFAEVLKAAPGDRATALRLYREAMLAGNRDLATRAAAVFAQGDAVPPEISWYMLGEAAGKGDWKTAAAWSDRISAEPAFAFVAPVLRAWIGLATGNPDPIALLQANTKGSAPSAYVAEHRAWLLLAMKNTEEGTNAIRSLIGAPGGRNARLQLGGAARLVQLGKRDEALALLDGSAGAIATARARVKAGGTLPGAIDTPAAGIAELMIRLGADLGREQPNPVALGLARMATFLDPGNAETWVVAGEMLAGLKETDLAVAAYDHVSTEDPLYDLVRASRLQVLARGGDQQIALAEAEKAAARPNAIIADHAVVGDILASLGRHRDAAVAYGRALALAEAAQPPRDDLWTYFLMRGGAYEQAGEWSAAKSDLERAVALAPDQPVALNYLGYAQLDRRENVAAATRLVEKASALDPQNAAITDSLGWAYYLSGNLPAAIGKLETAAVGEPADPSINEHLGDAYWTAGRRLEARYAWRAALVYAEDDVAARLRQKIDSGLTAPPTARK